MYFKSKIRFCLWLLFLCFDVVLFHCKPKDSLTSDPVLVSTLLYQISIQNRPEIQSITPNVVFENSKITIKGTNFLKTNQTKLYIDNKIEFDIEEKNENFMTARIPTGISRSGPIYISLGKASFAESSKIFFEKDLKYDSKFFPLVQNSSNLKNLIKNEFLTSSANGTQLTFFSEDTLPLGMSLDPNNGEVSGIPSELTTGILNYRVSCSPKDDPSAKLSGNFNLLVITAEEKPNRTCNYMGIASGCFAGFSHSCPNASSCFAFISDCQTSIECGF